MSVTLREDTTLLSDYKPQTVQHGVCWTFTFPCLLTGREIT